MLFVINDEAHLCNAFLPGSFSNQNMQTSLWAKNSYEDKAKAKTERKIEAN